MDHGVIYIAGVGALLVGFGLGSVLVAWAVTRIFPPPPW